MCNKSVVVRFDDTQNLEWVSNDGGMTDNTDEIKVFESPEEAQVVADTVEGAQVHTLAE